MPTLPTNPHSIGDSGHVNDHNTIVTALSGAVYASGQTGTVDLSGSTLKGAGLDCISPTSIANSGGTATQSLGSVTFTGVTSISLNGVFTSTYDNYRVVVNITSSSAQVQVQYRLRNAGTDSTASNYNYQQLFVDGTSVTASRSTAQAWGLLGYQVLSDISTLQMNVYGPALARRTLTISEMLSYGGGGYLSNSGNIHTLASTFDGITFQPVSGTFTGAVRVYGLRNA